MGSGRTSAVTPSGACSHRITYISGHVHLCLTAYWLSSAVNLLLYKGSLYTFNVRTPITPSIYSGASLIIYSI